MELTGYANRLSVFPGEDIRFMVSAELPDYDATIVRLLHGDPSPSGPGHREEAFESTVNGGYSGRFQPIRAGSYVLVATDRHLQTLKSLTVQTWIFPTTPDLGRYQGIVAALAPNETTGFALGLGESGDLEFTVGTEHGRHIVSTGFGLREREWYFVGPLRTTWMPARQSWSSVP